MSQPTQCGHNELPRTSRNVPAYRTHRRMSATVTRQLDFVFASNGLAARGENGPDRHV